MKKLLLITLGMFSLAAFAQKIHFTDTGNIWKELKPQYNDLDPPLLFYSTYSFVSDTIIGSVSYRRFNFEHEYGRHCCSSSLVREDTLLKKVYMRDETGDSDIVLMDYSLGLGDTFNASHNQFIVAGLDSTLVDSVWHKVWLFTTATGHFPGGRIYFIEGIGCIQHPTYMLWDFSGCVECMNPFMYCFSSHGSTPFLSPPVSFLNNTTSCTYFPSLLSANNLRRNDNIIRLYPNPATNELTISSSDKVTTLVLLNLLGQTVYSQEYNEERVQIDISNLPASIYFIRINGMEVRKFMKQ